MSRHHLRRFWDGGRVAVVFLLVGGLVRADDTPPSLAAIQAQFRRDEEAHRIKFQGISPADRPQSVAEYWTMTRATAKRAFAYARANPNAPDSLDAILWTVNGLVDRNRRRAPEEVAEAYRLLLEGGLDSDEVAPLIAGASVVGGCPEARQFAEAAVERSRSRLVRGAAALALARSDHETAQLARDLRDPIIGPELVSQIQKLDPPMLIQLQGVDPIAVDRRSAAMYERVLAEFADLRLPGSARQSSFGELAQGELDALRHLAVGQVAPDFTGEDVRGGAIRLSDHRGKVVVVVFWATWCGPCMGEVPNERKLVAQMAGRPFTLIGVDGDDDRKAAEKAMAEQSMTWPSVWNGGMNGGIVEAWGVRAWPTVYVLDAQGVIRFQNLRGEQLDRGVEHLVAEVEAKARANDKP